jgi:hypothetical protein
VTRGSWIHDDIVRHFRSCAQCRDVKPEEVRIQQLPALRLTVPATTLAAMCPDGRSIYRSYLRWLAEPDE